MLGQRKDVDVKELSDKISDVIIAHKLEDDEAINFTLIILLAIFKANKKNSLEDTPKTPMTKQTQLDSTMISRMSQKQKIFDQVVDTFAKRIMEEKLSSDKIVDIAFLLSVTLRRVEDEPPILTKKQHSFIERKQLPSSKLYSMKKITQTSSNQFTSSPGKEEESKLEAKTKKYFH